MKYQRETDDTRTGPADRRKLPYDMKYMNVGRRGDVKCVGRRIGDVPVPVERPSFSVDAVTLADELGKAYSRATGNETLDPVAIAVARELLSSRVVAVIFK